MAKRLAVVVEIRDDSDMQLVSNWFDDFDKAKEWAEETYGNDQPYHIYYKEFDK